MTNNDSMPIKSFRDLRAWQEAHRLAQAIYRFTKPFPNEELFGLTSQMKRCSVSVTSNLAEGFARETYKEKIRFYYIARGSAVELENQLLLARDVGYLPAADHQSLEMEVLIVQSLINGLIKKSRSFL